MLIPLQRLVDRARFGSRAPELGAIRGRMSELAEQAPDDPEARALGLELRALRERLSRAFGQPQSCRGCAAGHPEPFGHWRGGHCCGGQSPELFSDDELSALRRGGTTPAELRPPRAEHAGCVFRGPTGCSLEAVDRPNLCVRYTCRDLERELRARGDRAEIAALQAELLRVFERLRQRESELRGRALPGELAELGTHWASKA